MYDEIITALYDNGVAMTAIASAAAAATAPATAPAAAKAISFVQNCSKFCSSHSINAYCSTSS
jgi:hypothetical protein